MNYEKIPYIDYDKIFKDDLEKKFFYTDYRGTKMVVGQISLSNAVARLNKNEYYTFVTYYEGEILPEQYIPLEGLTNEDGILFATLNYNNYQMNNICIDGGIQMISRTRDSESNSPRYLLGPGPDILNLEYLIKQQYSQYLKSQTFSATKGSR